jgi:hypothetical protein
MKEQKPRLSALPKRRIDIEIQFQERASIITLRRLVAYTLLMVFILNTLGALAMLFLVGLNLMKLSNNVILAFIGSTVAQAAAMFITVTKFLFPVRKDF